MKLTFDAIDIANFKSFKAARLDIAARGTGLIMVRGTNGDEPRLGSNGAGKSSLFGALCWCLYGRTENGLRNPDIRPWGGSPGTTRVAVRFRTDGDVNEVVRTAEPNRLTLGGRTVGQESVDRLLVPYELFVHTILLGQGQPLFLDLPPREKLELFTTVLDLDVWDRRSFAAQRRSAEIEAKLITERAQLQATDEMLARANARIDEVKPRAEGFEAERQTKLAKIAADIKQANAAIAKLQPQIETAMLQVESEAELRLLMKDIGTLTQQLHAAARDKAVSEERVRLAKREVDRLTREREALRYAKKCPTCGQPVKRADLSEHLAEIDARLVLNERIVEDALEAADRSADEQALDSMLVEAKGMRERIDASSQVIAAHGERLIRLRADVPHWEREAEQLTAQDNPHRAVLEDARRQATQLSVRQRELEASLSFMDLTLARSRFWIKGFKEVRLQRTDEVLAELELATNAALAEVGLEGWGVRYVIEEETKAGTLKRGMAALITSPHNDAAVRWESWSGGEAQRLRLTCALTLADTLLAQANVECAFEVLDEPTAHLSGNGIRDLCEYLSERARGRNKSIYFIDHRALVETAFDGVVEITKQGGSRIL